MTVICTINPPYWEALSYSTGAKYPKVGEVVEVKEIARLPYLSLYHLKEYPDGAYNTNCFRPI